MNLLILISYFSLLKALLHWFWDLFIFLLHLEKENTPFLMILYSLSISLSFHLPDEVDIAFLIGGGLRFFWYITLLRHNPSVWLLVWSINILLRRFGQALPCFLHWGWFRSPCLSFRMLLLLLCIFFGARDGAVCFFVGGNVSDAALFAFPFPSFSVFEGFTTAFFTRLLQILRQEENRSIFFQSSSLSL